MPTSTSTPRDVLHTLPGPLRELAERGEVRRYAQGTLLIQEGDRGDVLYIIVKGKLRAFSINAADGREITFGEYSAGEYVGEMGLDGGPRSASVITTSPATCAIVTKKTLLEHLSARPEFALELIDTVIRRARAATLSTRQLAFNTVYGRVKELLETRAVRQPDGRCVVPAGLTHRAIAQQVGCSREMVSRVMKRLCEVGEISRGAAPLELFQRA